MTDTLIPPPNIVVDVFTQIICMFSLLTVSLHSVRVRVAVSNLGDRDVARVTAMEVDKPEESRSKWAKRARQPKWAALGSMAISLTLYALAQVFFSYILPHYASQSVMDWVYGVILGFFASCSCAGALNTLLPVPSGVRYARTNKLVTDSDLFIEWVPLRPVSQRPFVYWPLVRYVLATILGAVIVIGSASGWPVFGAFGEATIILCFPYWVPIVTVRRLSQVILALSAFSIAFCALVGGLAATFGPEPKKDSARNDDKDTLPGFWVLQLACMLFDGMAWVASGFLVVLTTRYEHQEAFGTPLVERDEATQSVIIPTSQKLATASMSSKPTDLALIGIIVTYCCMLGLHIVSWLDGMAAMMLFGPMLGIFVVPPVVVTVLMLAAKVAGKFGSWWNYCEVWCGKASDLETGAAAFALEDQLSDEDRLPKGTHGGE